ncbi:MAG: TIGR02757 family protein [Polyangiaceae bacterium]|nr:TIGR02757 family protein [Polyangiaceae bacterium]
MSARARLAKVKALLEAIRAREDLRARRSADPVDFVHRYTQLEDRELVALVSAACAFGNVKVIGRKLTELFALVALAGPSPSAAADAPRELRSRLNHFRHRVLRGDDLWALLVGARKLQLEAGSLGAAFVAELARADAANATEKAAARGDEADALKEALASFCDLIRIAGGLPCAGERGQRDKSGRRGPSHVLANVRAGSAAKRLLLFLRWMVRPADGIDLGLWDVPARRLVIPVDVHIHRLGYNLGLTSRRDVSWKTAVEITKSLAFFDEHDPVRYDFSLCHLGMIQNCPSHPNTVADTACCSGCEIKPVCVNW